MVEFDVRELATKRGVPPDKLRGILRVLEIPPKKQRHHYHWELLRQVIERKHIVTMPIEVGARVIFPIGIHYIEKITERDGITYLWALGKPFPIDRCLYLYPNDRLSDWFGRCPKCYQNASDYLPRQRAGDRWVGGYAFCDACNVSWKLPTDRLG